MRHDTAVGAARTERGTGLERSERRPAQVVGAGQQEGGRRAAGLARIGVRQLRQDGAESQRL